MKTILLIEDDENLSRGISFTFEKDGYNVTHADTVTRGLECFTVGNIDLIILDIGLPDGNGIDLCREIRNKSDVPIIILTARDLETDEVSGLLAGADDYITKPFSLSVLRARVAAQFRRLESKQDNILRSGKYKLNNDSCKFYKDDEEITVSVTEFKLLRLFMIHAGQVLTKEQIFAALWDNDANFVDENTLSVNISRLRAKIEVDPKKPLTIKTIHGVGYIWIKS
jgi:Response regulators consisting of a CheY-like receiver domain and a winged-helix DNA-binding domain